jgi:hypothetical protein
MGKERSGVTRFFKWAAGALLLLVVLGTAVLLPRMARLSNIGTGYLAKQMCSCIFVGEREFDACRSDMPASMAKVQAALLESEPGVKAWIPVFAERRARYRAGSGCTLY